MNKGISLAIVAVLLCAMGIIFFMNIKADNGETDLARAPLEEIRPTATPETPGASPEILPGTSSASSGDSSSETAKGLPLIADKTKEQAQSTPPQKSVQAEKQPAVTKPAEKPVATKTTPTSPAQSTSTTETTAQTSTPSLKPLDTPIHQPTTPAVSQASKPQVSTDGHTLSKIGLHFKGNDIYLRIEAHSPFKTKIFALTEPDRLVVDLVGTWHNVTPPTIPSNQLVTKARIGSQPNATRLVLDLSRSTKYTIDKPSDSVLEVLMQ